MASLHGASTRRTIITITIIVTTIDRDSQDSVREKVVGLLRESFGWGFWGFAAFALLSGLACYLILGPETFADALDDDLAMVGSTLPRIVLALAVAGLVWVMLPRDRLMRLIGRESGLRGLLIATAAGVVTPGGPASAYPFLAVLAGSGADRGALVAYIVSWSMLGMQRILVWDVPFMGADFSLLRFTVSLPLPLIAGLIARRLSFELVLAGEPGGRR
jgi:Predicted permease